MAAKKGSVSGLYGGNKNLFPKGEYSNGGWVALSAPSRHSVSFLYVMAKGRDHNYFNDVIVNLIH